MIPVYLTQNILLFGELLRNLGLNTNTKGIMTAIEGLSHIIISNKIDFYHTLRSTLVNDVEHYPHFDIAFNTFWENSSGNLGDVHQQQIYANNHSPDLPTETIITVSGEEIHNNKSNSTSENQTPSSTQSYSYQEMLRHKDFSGLSPNQKSEIEKMISNIKWVTAKYRSRRWESSNQGEPSWRHTLRKNMRHGGEILLWSHRSSKLKSQPLVIIVDISGSMEVYSTFFLHFMHSFTNMYAQAVESFVFGTRLTRITRPLRMKKIKFALEAVSNCVEDWSGGTRIGESIKIFNRNWAARVLRRNAAVILISDGWDRGDAELLQKEIALLQRNCSRLIWLNPLLGSPNYQPLTRGMQTSMPYIDDFLPAHNLVSLEDFSSKLSKLPQTSQLNRSAQFVL